MYQQLGDRWALEGEFRDWIPIDGSNFAVNVIRYGAAVSYLKQNYETLAQPARGLSSGEMLRPDEEEALPRPPPTRRREREPALGSTPGVFAEPKDAR